MPVPMMTTEASRWMTPEIAKAETDAELKDWAEIVDPLPLRGYLDEPVVPGLEGWIFVESVDGKVDNLATADRDTHWHWVGGRQGSPPRATLRYRDVLYGASRLVFQWLRPEDFLHNTLKRTCDVPMCVNPWHHESVPNGHWKRTEGYEERQEAKKVAKEERRVAAAWRRLVELCGQEGAEERARRHVEERAEGHTREHKTAGQCTCDLYI